MDNWVRNWLHKYPPVMSQLNKPRGVHKKMTRFGEAVYEVQVRIQKEKNVSFGCCKEESIAGSVYTFIKKHKSTILTKEDLVSALEKEVGSVDKIMLTKFVSKYQKVAFPRNIHKICFYKRKKDGLLLLAKAKSLRNYVDKMQRMESGSYFEEAESLFRASLPTFQSRIKQVMQDRTSAGKDEAYYNRLLLEELVECKGMRMQMEELLGKAGKRARR